MKHQASITKDKLYLLLKQKKGFVPITIFIIIAFSMLAQYSIHIAFAQTNSDTKTIRIGYFPNINHAQAVIGLNNGDFQKILGNNTKIETIVFNAGPSAIEALLANRIDATYIGPNPTINGYVASDGKDVRIVSGVSSGGASFVVRNDAGIQSVKDLGGKKFASPELGNTQDISLRKYIVNNGFKTIENGGNVTIVPVANADILTLFLKKEIAGAWVPEPWATRLVNEANGKIFVDERDLWPPQGKFVTANIIVRTDYLKENPDVIKKLLEAHVNETLWINQNKEKAINEFNVNLKKLTGKTIANDVLTNALTKLEFTYDPIKISLVKDANDAYDLGLLAKGKDRPSLSGIYDLTLLDKVLAEKGLASIEQGVIPGLVNKANTSNTTSGDALADIVS
ncbi:MAG TPA: ABC transporter substrate-binding protein [Candidatus Nitrosocosmicus sp.]